MSAQPDRHAAHRDREIDANSGAGELEDNAVCVSETYACCAASQSSPGTDRELCVNLGDDV
jgi:hypothetical protein